MNLRSGRRHHAGSATPAEKGLQGLQGRGRVSVVGRLGRGLGGARSDAAEGCVLWFARDREEAVKRLLVVVDGLRDNLYLDDQRGERRRGLEREVDVQVKRLCALRELVLEADDLERPVTFRERLVGGDNMLRSLDDHGSSEAVAQLFRARP